jgi:dihydrofolate reductase
MPRISLIAAVARNGVIGRGNALPWHLPADLAHFKRLTLDKPILMGRRTFESLPGRLPKRTHIVVSSDPRFQPEGVAVARTPEAGIALAAAVPELMVIGGASMYRACLPLASRLYLTWVEAEIPGDVCFPPFDARQWREQSCRAHPADARNPLALRFVTLERLNAPASRVPDTRG